MTEPESERTGRDPAMDPSATHAMIDAMAAALGLSIEPEWRETVASRLRETLELGRLVACATIDQETDSLAPFTP